MTRATADERRHMALVRAMPCLITGGRPVTLHHVRRHGMPTCHYDVLPLVLGQHQVEHGRDSLEGNKAAWEQRYGCQEYWLGVVDGILGIWHERVSGKRRPVRR